ncbi:MAG TPA: hypothetical protein VK907_11725, partial [Phnomibacter sp.]|nr:hypothetical protein [Phnomibacter sp.]
MRISDQNSYANLLSTKKNAKVILITDACRSGRLAGDGIEGRKFVGQQLLRVQRNMERNEVRIASCGPDELSAENEAWGGGRGVFSYYLLQGLQGLAVSPNANGVTGADVKTFLARSFATDAVLTREQHKQTPLVEGNIQMLLSRPGPDDIKAASAQRPAGKALPAGLQMFSTRGAIPVQPLDMLANKLRAAGIDSVLDFRNPYNIDPKEFPQRVLSYFNGQGLSADEGTMLEELRDELRTSPDAIRRFNERMAAVISDRGHQMISAYLTGDRAELEKRSYYNLKNREFDKYINMFTYALKLISPDHFLYRGLHVDRDYFQGVLHRLEINVFGDRVKERLKSALGSLQRANRLEPFAPYVHNELGNVFADLEQFDSALHHYHLATELAPTWAVPWANLVGLYNAQKNLKEARQAANRARSIQPDLFSLLMNEGYTEELAANFLRAEELYSRGLDQNKFHFFPYERSGHLFSRTMRYSVSDRHFYEAEKRRDGFFFPEGAPTRMAKFWRDEPERARPPLPCDIFGEPQNISDPLVLTVLASQFAQVSNDTMAELFFRRAVQMGGDKQFLAQHHYGKWLFQKDRYLEAEKFLSAAVFRHIDKSAFEKVLNEWIVPDADEASLKCLKDQLGWLHYPAVETAYLLGSIYDTLGYYDEAEKQYREIVSADTSDWFATGYFKMAMMYTRAAMYQK